MLDLLKRVVARIADEIRRRVHAVVRVARHWDRDIGAERLGAGRAEGEHLHVDAGRVHVRDALGADVHVLGDDVVAHHLAPAGEIEIAVLVPAHVLAIHRREEVLLDRDDSHASPLSL